MLKSIEIKSEEDLLPPGAEPGTIPTDLEQSTGLERFEILGKMQGIDVFDMRPLDSSRKGALAGGQCESYRCDEAEASQAVKTAGEEQDHCYDHRTNDSLLTSHPSSGTLDNPIIVKSAGDEQFAGCTGYPVDSHGTIWLGGIMLTHTFPPPKQLSRTRPLERCTECGGVYKMEYVGPPDDAHGHGHGHGEEAHGDASHNYEEPKTLADFVRPEYRGGPPGFVHPT
ncbi:MAG: hypothetical protein Q9217_005588 [Psora testacea]